MKRALFRTRIKFCGLTRAGDVRLAAGAGRRTNEFLWDNRITDTVGAQGRESSTFAYAELFFTDVLWPDFSAAHLREALDQFGARERRFGGR